MVHGSAGNDRPAALGECATEGLGRGALTEVLIGGAAGTVGPGEQVTRP